MGYTNRVDVLPNRGWDERILLCRNGDLVTTFIVVARRAVVLVDTMMNEITARALLDVARPYLGAGRKLIVVNTHADFDHAWGNQLFAGPHPEHAAPIVASRACADVFARGEVSEELGSLSRRHPGLFDGVVLTPPTDLDGEYEIHGGDLTLRLFPTPGHTDDHVAIHIPEIDTLLAGDAAELPFPVAAAGPSRLPALRASLDALAAVRAGTVLYCHAPESIGPDLVHENRAYFHALEVRVRAARRRGVRAHSENLAREVGCPIEDVIPDGWLISDDARRQHEAQLHTMFTLVADTKTPASPSP